MISLDSDLQTRKEELKLMSALKNWLENTRDGFQEEKSYKELSKLIDARQMTLKRRPTEIKFGEKNLADHYTCHYCKLAHRKVEAGGMWFCPNVSCAGPGNHGARKQLVSYHENANGSHSVDNQDWKKFCEAYLLENEVDVYIREAVEAGIKRLSVNITSDKFGI